MSDPFIAALRAQQPGYQAGWGQLEYSGWQDEQLSWKTGCYLGDWSFLMDLEISGPDALRLFSDHTINSYASFPVGKAKHAVFCSSTGKVIVEGVLMRMADDVFRIQSGPAPFVDFIASKGGYDVSTRRIHTFQLQVSGPEALAVCQAVTGEDLTDIRFMHFRPVTIAGCTVYPVRQGMAGEVGFEFHGDDADKAAVEDAILRAGAAHGIRRLGRRTAMINHLEAAFPTGLWHYTPDFLAAEAEGFAEFSVAKWGHGTPASLRGSFEPQNPADLTFSPYELGWGRSVAFDHDFVGRAALEREVATGTARKRVTLEFDSDAVVEIYASLFEEDEQPFAYLDVPHPQQWVIWADEVRRDGQVIGVSSTPGYSLWFRRVLSLAFVAPACAEPGTRVETLWGPPGSRQTLIGATVRPAPIKHDNRRADLTAKATKE